MVYDGVQMNVMPGPQPGSYRIRISPQSVDWISAGNTTYTDFVLIVSTFDRKGKELDRKVRSLRVRSDSSAQSTSRSIGIIYNLAPDPKAVRAHFVVRLSDSGRIGSRDHPLTPISGADPGKK